MTSKQPLTIFAFLGQSACFLLCKVLLLGTVHHLVDGLLTDVSKAVLWTYEVVAAIDIAVALHHSYMSAQIRHRTDAWRNAHIVGQCCLEDVYIDLAHILLLPLIEDLAEEAPPLRRGDIATYGGELQILAPYLLEEAIDLAWMLAVDAVHRTERIPHHPVFVEQFYGSHHLMMSGRPMFILSPGIMQRFWTVDAQTYQPIVIMKELAPLIRQQCPVCLQTVVDMSPSSIPLLQAHRLLIKGYRQQCRLTTMPCKQHLLVHLTLQILLNEALQHLVAHQLLPYPFIIAVATRQVASRPHGFGHHIERTGKRR